MCQAGIPICAFTGTNGGYEILSGITKVFGLVFKDNDVANDFWEKQGYTLRANLNYRNKSLNENVPQGGSIPKFV